jgi:serine protease inhibitor
MQALEIRCINNSISMGILLSKNDSNIKINEETLPFLIDNMKETVLDEVKIPMFRTDFKVTLTKTLHDIGLSSLFKNLSCPALFPKKVLLHDCKQNITIIVSDMIQSKSSLKRGAVSNTKFICNRPFTYYFKLLKTNTILVLGNYC